MSSHSTPHCPICRKASVLKFMPFCSSRCADVDLGRWLTENYKVPTEEQASAQDDTAINLNHED